MGNWLSTEPGLSSVDTIQIPSGQRDDNRRGGEETERKGRNQIVVEGYILTVFTCSQTITHPSSEHLIPFQPGVEPTSC